MLKNIEHVKAKDEMAASFEFVETYVVSLYPYIFMNTVQMVPNTSANIKTILKTTIVKVYFRSLLIGTVCITAPSLKSL